MGRQKYRPDDCHRYKMLRSNKKLQFPDIIFQSGSVSISEYYFRLIGLQFIYYLFQLKRPEINIISNHACFD